MTSPLRLANKGVQFYTPVAVGYDLVARHLRRKKPHILITCMPKSGSTFLSNTLASYPGVSRRKLLPTYGAREQELCELRLCLYNGTTYVAQQHLRNSEWTEEMIRRYGLSTVVLVRDLLDCVASIRDHIRQTKNFGALIALPAHFETMTDEELENLIVQMAMPWYISFYKSWQNTPGVLHVNYADVSTNPAKTVGEILDYAGIEKTDAHVEKALQDVQGKRTRFNKGVAGRGRDVSASAQEKLRDMVQHYPEIAGDRIFTSLWQK